MEIKAYIVTAEQVINWDFLSPSDLPKKPATKEAANGKKTNK